MSDAAARGKAWRAANPDKVKAANRAWVVANGPKVAAWRKANPEKCAEYERNCRLNNYARYMWRGLKDRSMRLGRPFSLTYEQAKALLETTPVCPVLGMLLVRNTGKAQDNSPSFDCFIPELGYVPGNVAVISWRANKIKHNATVDELQRVAAWAARQPLL
jgi:hypothetical protein